MTGVAVIPLSSQNDAAKALLQAQRSLTDKKDYSSGTDSSAESDSDQSDAPGLEQTSSHQDGLPVGNDGETPTAVAGHHNESHIAEDVIKKRGHYRRFASQWFFDKIWQGEGKASADAGSRKLSDPAAQGRESNRDLKRRDSSESMELNETDSKGKAVSPPQAPASVEDEVRTYELMPKFLRYTKMFFGSRSFYFSYDYDISRRFGTQNPQDSRLPLSTRADPLVSYPSMLESVIASTNLILVFLE